MKIGKTDVVIIGEDITKVNVQTIIITVPKNPPFMTGIDHTIINLGGENYYKHLENMTPLKKHDVVIVEGTSIGKKYFFDNIIFIAVEGTIQNDIITKKALLVANEKKYERIVMPVFGQSYWRQGDTRRILSIAEKTKKGIENYFLTLLEGENHLREINIVINDHEEMKTIMSELIEEINRKLYGFNAF